MSHQTYWTVRPRFWAILFTLLLMLSAALYWSHARYMARQEADIALLQAEKEALVDRAVSLQSSIDFTSTDAYIEREARGKLGLIKPGEVLFETNEQ